MSEPIPCGGCGATSNEQRCIGCLHDFGTTNSAWVRDFGEALKEQDVRTWLHYPIIMPVTADGKGPATVGIDATDIVFEVWDQMYNSHGSFDNLPDAINEAMRLNGKS